MHFSGQIKGHNAGRKHNNWTNDLNFSLTFSTLLFITFMFISENSQIFISCGTHFDPFWSVNFRNF